MCLCDYAAVTFVVIVVDAGVDCVDDIAFPIWVSFGKHEVTGILEYAFIGICGHHFNPSSTVHRLASAVTLLPPHSRRCNITLCYLLPLLTSYCYVAAANVAVLPLRLQRMARLCSLLLLALLVFGRHSFVCLDSFFNSSVFLYSFVSLMF